jgi:hypothetical protein
MGKWKNNKILFLIYFLNIKNIIFIIIILGGAHHVTPSECNLPQSGALHG